MAEVRVGRVNGEYVINPTLTELKESDIDMIVGGTADSVLMMEGEMDEISEEDMLGAIKAAHASIITLCEFQEELREEFGKPKREFTPEGYPEEIENKVRELATSKIKDVVNIGLNKEDYSEKLKEAKDSVVAELEEEYEEEIETIKDILGDVEKEELRNMVLEKNVVLTVVIRKTFVISGLKLDILYELMVLLSLPVAKLRPLCL